MPERLSQCLDIPLQGLLVAACASPDAAVPMLTALGNRWEALSPERSDGDIRQQATLLREMLQVMVHADDALQANAQRCLTRLNRFLDIPLNEPLRKTDAQMAQSAPTLATLTEAAEESREAEASEKEEAASHQRIQEQYGSLKRDDTINRLF